LYGVSLTFCILSVLTTSCDYQLLCGMVW